MREQIGTAVAITMAVLAWSTLALQCVLSVNLAVANGHGRLAGLVRFFSFFTVLTNILVALVVTAGAVPSGRTLDAGADAAPRPAGRQSARNTRARLRSWLSGASGRGAAATYIGMVGIVYSLLLRATWDPEGLQRFADIILHDVMPPAYVLYWLLFGRNGTLRWRSVLPWLAYPLVYLLWCLLHGAIDGWYPYPFIDVGRLGYAPIVVNVIGFVAAFAALGLIVVALDRAANLRLGPSVTRPAAR